MKKLTASLLLIVCVLSLLAGSAFAQGSDSAFVTDDAGLLQEAQLLLLEQQARAAAEEYSVGVYIVTVRDYRELDSAGVYEAASALYHERLLGEGPQRSGILLLLSMDGRDYALYRYGAQAVYAFNDYGLGELEDAFLKSFSSDDWNGGFENYIRECTRYLEKAEAGRPVRKSPAALIVIFNIIALLIAAIVCGVMAGQMKTVYRSSGAGDYAGELKLTEQYDQFTHRTETRRKIESSQSSGSESRSGGSNGKF